MLQASGSGKVSPCQQIYYTVQAKVPPDELRCQQSNPSGPGKTAVCHIAKKKDLRYTIIIKKILHVLYSPIH